MNKKNLWFVPIVPIVLGALLVVWTVRPLTVGQGAEEISNPLEQAISGTEALKELSEALMIQAANTKSQEREAERLEGMKDERLHKLDAGWRDIDSYVASERARIEAWYSESIARLQAEGERRLKQLEGEERAAYARCLQEMKNTTAVSEKHVTEHGYGYANVYVDAFGRAVVDDYETKHGRETETTDTSVKGNPTADYEVALDRLRKSEHATELDLRRARKRLDLAREYKLMGLEEEAQRRRDVMAWKRGRVSKEVQEAASDSGAPLVEGIGMSAENTFYAFINGVPVNAGDEVNGFAVVKIDMDRVEFQKDGQTFVREMK